MNIQIRRGEEQTNAKLTRAKVAEIRFKAAAGVKQKYLALEYGVHPRTISRAVRRELWV